MNSHQHTLSTNIEHRTSNIEHRTSNIEHRTSNIEHRTSNILRRACRSLFALLAAFGLIAASLNAQATVVNVAFTNLGGSHYSAAIAVVNDGAPAAISGFTLYFDEARFTNLSLINSPTQWDSLLIQPDLGLPAAGFLDSIVINPLDALQLGQTQRGFNIGFDYIGQGLPGGMAFDINDADFNVLFSGTSTTVPAIAGGVNIPEPGAVWLMLLAVGCLAATRGALNRKNVDHRQAEAASFAQVAA